MRPSAARVAPTWSAPTRMKDGRVAAGAKHVGLVVVDADAMQATVVPIESWRFTAPIETGQGRMLVGSKKGVACVSSGGLEHFEEVHALYDLVRLSATRFAATTTDGELVVFDEAAQVIARRNLGSQMITVLPVGEAAAWVTHSGAEVSRVDAALDVVATWTLPGTVFGGAVLDDGDLIVVAGQEALRVSTRGPRPLRIDDRGYYQVLGLAPGARLAERAHGMVLLDGVGRERLHHAFDPPAAGLSSAFRLDDGTLVLGTADGRALIVDANDRPLRELDLSGARDRRYGVSRADGASIAVHGPTTTIVDPLGRVLVDLGASARFVSEARDGWLAFGEDGGLRHVDRNGHARVLWTA